VSDFVGGERGRREEIVILMIPYYSSFYY